MHCFRPVAYGDGDVGFPDEALSGGLDMNDAAGDWTSKQDELNRVSRNRVRRASFDQWTVASHESGEERTDG